ncbi:UNVERIFIED_CONTAM: hypothetical protein H355_003008, partial [Colinus virginianus]
DNIILFLRGCKELGLKESQLFDPGDLQDTSNRVTVKNIDCSRKLKNVLVTIYWLGKAANSCTAYSGSTLNLKEFEGLLAQMRKETEDIESPKRSIRDSGYIDCWDSERSDSLSPPRHGRDDSFDSLDSFGSRSQQTPSPDVVLRGSSDGRGSDSETDLPHRKMPDVKKDDMLARRTSHGEPKSAVPFNQYLPNKSNQTFYVPAPLRKKKAEREEYRKSWSTATSPLGDRPFSKPETIEEEQSETSGLGEKEKMGSIAPEESPVKIQADLNQNEGNSIDQSHSGSVKETSLKGKDEAEIRKLRRLEQAGITVMSAAQRYGSKKQTCEDNGSIPDIILRKENPFMTRYQGKDSGSEDEAASKVPDLEKDDFATRRARMNQPKHVVPFNSFIIGPYTQKDKSKLEDKKKPLKVEKQERARGSQVHVTSARQTVTCKETSLLQTEKNKSEDKEQVKVVDAERDDLAKWKSQCAFPQLQEDTIFVNASITKADLETWKRLKLSGEPSEEDCKCPSDIPPTAQVTVEAAVEDDFAVRKARANRKAGSLKQKFVHFGPVTEIDQQKWDKLSIGRASRRCKAEGESRKDKVEVHSDAESSLPTTAGSLQFAERGDAVSKPQNDPSTVTQEESQEQLEIPHQQSGGTENKVKFPDPQRDDMLARRTGAFLKQPEPNVKQFLPMPFSKQQNKQGTARELEKKTVRQGGMNDVFGQFDLHMIDKLKEYKLFNTVLLVIPSSFRSMSMFDMRSEEEAMAQPHSKARHEKLQNIHNQLKEDETRWQDDLARWKSRRRSASQDLIKKEAERKKMERLLSGEGTNERRKSIKTYREIVEEKEKRERELHEAYKNAKTQEEAESILQQYIERFTISEAVLERLQMPKILERSHSVEPNSPLKDPNPLRYLRQQSLPAPKFTATIEATIVPTTELEPSGSTGRTSPSKSVVSKAVPMLTPKPYSQPKNTQEVLKNFKVGYIALMKVDGKVSMNGENFNGVEEKDKECTTVIFTQSPSRSLKFDGVARGDRPPIELKKDPTMTFFCICGLDSEQKQFKSTVVCASPVVKSLEFSPSPVPPEETAPSEKDVKKPEMEKQKEAALPAMQEVMKPKALEQEGSVVLPFLKKLPETSQVTLHNSDLQADSDNSDKSNRFNFWSWDPEEERKRQERWQHEQERLLQEKYQKEQDKLKEEWEKAQREVEEEERRYYEEERKIIEDTVVPFIVSSNSAELLSSSSSTTEGNKTVNTSDSNGSPEEGKPKEVTKHKKLLWEQDRMPPVKNKENEHWQEKRSSGNKVLSGHPEMGILKGGDQEHQVPVMERCSPARLNLPLTQDVPWNQQLLTKQSPHHTEDAWQRPLLGQSAGQQPSSTGEGRRQCLSPRSVSGKKLCSTCGLPLGKGAAMIIETLGLYFHIQCFRCGICKGQLGDAASGTDVRIRNGLLNCNDCYIRSRTAGQPTTL